jgi:hypothetical protein
MTNDRLMTKQVLLEEILEVVLLFPGQKRGKRIVFNTSLTKTDQAEVADSFDAETGDTNKSHKEKCSTRSIAL